MAHASAFGSTFPSLPLLYHCYNGVTEENLSQVASFQDFSSCLGCGMKTFSLPEFLVLEWLLLEISEESGLQQVDGRELLYWLPTRQEELISLGENKLTQAWQPPCIFLLWNQGNPTQDYADNIMHQ